MASRMEKYHSNEEVTHHSRSIKNEHLYENLYNNKIITEFADVEKENVVNLSTLSKTFNKNRRENYQKNKLFSDSSVMTLLEEKSENPIQNLEESSLEEKNYNINDILAQAKKNRSIEDSQEEKQRFKTVEYNIISDLSEEKKKENKEKKKPLSKDEEENLEELIHTITSNSLRKKIDDELLGDLLPTEEDESIISPELLKDIQEKAETYVPKKTEEEEKEDITGEMDQSFYTKSMDLSDQDFVSKEEEEDDRSFLEDAKMSLPRKILLFLFIIIIIGIIGYIIFRFI